VTDEKLNLSRAGAQELGKFAIWEVPARVYVKGLKNHLSPDTTVKNTAFTNY
jgi:hypothetical protein